MKTSTLLGPIALSFVALAMTLPAGVASAVELLAVDDTWVREDNPYSNRNDDDQMNLRTDVDAGDDNDLIFLRFDVSPLKSDVASATLRLFWQRTTDDSKGKVVKVYGLNENATGEDTWTEGMITYAAAPGLLPDNVSAADERAAKPDASEAEFYDLNEADTTYLGEVTVPEAGAVEGETLDFSSDALRDFVNAESDGDGITLILVRDQSDSGHQLRFGTKEITQYASGGETFDAGTAAPRLIVETAP